MAAVSAIWLYHRGLLILNLEISSCLHGISETLPIATVALSNKTDSGSIVLEQDDRMVCAS